MRATKQWLLLPTVLSLLVAAPAAPLPGADPNEEQQLISVLQSNASPKDKDAACARLKRIGTVKSVAALSALLTDEQLSHSARYALESLPTPEAGQALADALGKTSGLTRAGVINSLGVRGEVRAIPELTKLVVNSDVTVAAAAATALGQIATPEAMHALPTTLGALPAPVHEAVVDAELRVAQHLTSSGGQSEAVAIYQRLYETENKDAIRVAAYRGIILGSGARALELMSDAIAGKSGPSQLAALQLVHEIVAPEATGTFMRLLPRVGVPVQLALIEGLGQRSDRSATPAIAALTGSPVPEVRLAAINALGLLGDAAAVAALSESAVSANAAEQGAAREALAQLHYGPVTQTLLAEMATAKPAVQAELARALGARGEAAAIPKLLKLARQETGSTYKAAVQALAQLVDQSQLASLVQLVIEAKDDSARAQAAEALNSACQHLQTKHGRVDVGSLVDGLAASSVQARAALLPICAGFADPKVRTALRASVTDSDPNVRAAAIRAMCDTMDAELLPDLQKLACSLPEENLRTLAIGGCVRLTTQEESVKIPNAQRIETLGAILTAGPTAEQKRLVLAGLAEVPDVEALNLAQPLLDEPAVQGEAVRAVIKIAAALPTEAAQPALKKALAVAQDAATRQTIEAALNRPGAGAGFITAWQMAGPYQQAGKDFAALFDIVFAPETAEAQGVSWQPLPAGTDARRPWFMDLRKALGNGEECVAYARTWVRCEQEQSAQLEVGSDDGVKIWLNRKEILAQNVARAFRPGSDKVAVTLNAGWNLLLLKVTQHNNGWAFSARLVNSDGAPLAGLQFDTGAHLNQSSGASPNHHAS